MLQKKDVCPIVSRRARPCLYPPPSEAVRRGLRADDTAVALLEDSLEFLRNLRLNGDDPEDSFFIRNREVLGGDMPEQPGKLGCLPQKLSITFY